MGTERLTLEAATGLARAALHVCGTAPEAAAIVADALVLAEASGQGGHGMSRVPSYAGQVRTGKVAGDAVPELSVVKPAALRVDAGHGFFYPAFALALPELVARAQSHGIAACAIHRSHHFGVAGHACEALAERGCLGLIYGNSPKALAPAGGVAPLLGTNPVAFAAPAPGAPLVIDLAVSTVARGKILAAREAGTPIPQGWAVGPDGAPTTDPGLALKGALAPMGGAKGAAIALMVEVMSACLAGAALSAEASSLFEADGAPPDLGQVILAVDGAALSGGAFAGRIADLVALYEAASGVRLPGARRLEARARAAREGLELNTALLGSIRHLLS